MTLDPRLAEVERKLGDAGRGSGQLRQAARRAAALARTLSPSGGGPCLIEFDFAVTDLLTGLPVSGALVQVLNSLGGVAGYDFSDTGGAASVTVVGVDSYRYDVSAPTYVEDAGPLPAAGCGGTAAAAVSLMPGVAVAWCPNLIPVLIHGAESVYSVPIALLSNVAGNGPQYWSGCGVVPGTAGGCSPAGGTPEFMALDGRVTPPKLVIRYVEVGLGNLCPKPGDCTAGGTSFFLTNNSTTATINSCSALNLSFSGTALGATFQKFFAAGAAWSASVTP